MSAWEIRQGDALALLREMPEASVQCVVTSPPYWGLRDYGTEGQLGLERTPDEYVARMVEVFREVRRVLRPDGTLWLNLGDSYAGAASGSNPSPTSGLGSGPSGASKHRDHVKFAVRRPAPGLKPKDLVGIPWRVAFALQADGWWLRMDHVWAKPNPMPESVEDRCTRAHEYLFLLTKAERYFYDAEAIAEPASLNKPWAESSNGGAKAAVSRNDGNKYGLGKAAETTRNRRSVWTIATEPFPEAHFAVMPQALVEPCALAGSSPRACEQCGAPWERVVERDHPGDRSKVVPTYESEGVLNRRAHPGPHHPARRESKGWQPTCSCEGATGSADCLVLDPFCGSGTVGIVALRHGRRFLGLELNPKYVEMARRRIAGPLFAGLDSEETA